MLQYCDTTQCKNSVRQFTAGSLAKRMDLGHTVQSKPWKTMIG